MKFFILMISVMMLPGVTTSGTQEEWKLKREKESIKVYTRKPDGSKLLDLKITMQVETSLNELIAALDDVESHKDWVFRCSESKILEQTSENSFYYYVKMNFPIPAKDRDIVIFYERSQDPVTKIISTQSIAASEKFHEKSDAIRIMDFNSSYLITPGPNGMVDVEYFLRADPAGYLPSWMVNLGVAKGPLKTMETLIERIEKGLYQNIDVLGIEELTQ